MSCPPGTILNPRTFRCIRVTGKRARNLAAAGNIPEYELPPRPATAAAENRLRRTTYRRAPRQAHLPPLAAAFGVPVARMPRTRAYAEPRAPAAPRIVTCPPGSIQNPTTGRCIKIGGRVYKQLYPPAPAAPAAPAPPPRRATSEPSDRVPAGKPTVIPIGPHEGMLQWTAANCANATDPIKNEPFVLADDLGDIVRLHDSTCVSAAALNRIVATQHRAGKIATVPGDSADAPLTLDDFRALRDSMRRKDPGYKLPGRRHQPPPPEWQLYVASDARSGPDFASVLYVDTTRAVRTAFGVEYPPHSIRVDLGFIPVATPIGSLCSAQTLVDLLDRLSKTNRLLMPIAGGWKPTVGMPYSKRHWETDTTSRVNRFCRELAKALTTPL